MDKWLRVLVCTALLMVAGCTADGSVVEECPDDAACAPTVTVPDVEHRELRSAYRELLDAGFSVAFSLPRRNDMYYEYAVNRARKGRVKLIHPEPWVGDIDPEPGTQELMRSDDNDAWHYWPAEEEDLERAGYVARSKGPEEATGDC